MSTIRNLEAIRLDRARVQPRGYIGSKSADSVTPPRCGPLPLPATAYRLLHRPRAGSVLICPFQAPSAASIVHRTHCETVWFFAFAAASTALIPSTVKRTGRILPFAAPLGSFGLPGLRFFWCWFSTSKLLHDCRFNCHHRRSNSPDVEHSYMSPRLLWVVSAVRPSIDSLCAAFCQCSDYRNLFVGTEYVCHAYYCITQIAGCQVLLCYNFRKMKPALIAAIMLASIVNLAPRSEAKQKFRHETYCPQSREPKCAHGRSCLQPSRATGWARRP